MVFDNGSNRLEQIASDDQGGQIVIDSDTLYVSGSTFGDFYGTNAGGSDYFVARMDTTGHEMIRRTIWH